jgi:hypothetical protein
MNKNDKEKIIKILNYFEEVMFVFEEDKQNDIITKRKLRKLINRIEKEE